MKERKFIIEITVKDPDDSTEPEELINQAIDSRFVASWSLDKEVKKRFKPPTLEELIEYAKLKNILYPERFANSFINFYESKGWMIGKNKMLNWKAAVNTWISKEPSHVKRDNQTIDRDGYTGQFKF